MDVIKRELLLEEVKGDQEMALQLLAASHPLFLPMTIDRENDKITLAMTSPAGTYKWEKVEKMTNQEKLRHLINIGEIFEALNHTVYSYELSPEQLLFTLNAMPLLVIKGIRNQVIPYDAPTASEFLLHYQALIVSLIDKKTQYEMLVKGKLPFYSGNLFCEKVVKAQSLEEIQELLTNYYQEEQEKKQQTTTSIEKGRLARLKMMNIVAGVGVILCAFGLGYTLFVSLPRQEMISQLRLAFIQKDYSQVVTTIKETDSKTLSQEDKYIVALSVIMTQSLTDEQRQELSKISIQSNEDYLRYWILIGQSRIDEAIDIASFLDDPQLLMYGMTKKIDDIQRDPSLTAQERTTQLNDYKTKLDELKKTYLTPEAASDEATTSGSGQ